MSGNLTVHFQRLAYLVSPTSETLPLGGKAVRVHEWEDGCVELHCEGRILPYSIFDKNPIVSQGAIVANKRLGAVLAAIQGPASPARPRPPGLPGVKGCAGDVTRAGGQGGCARAVKPAVRRERGATQRRSSRTARMPAAVIASPRSRARKMRSGWRWWLGRG